MAALLEESFYKKSQEVSNMMINITDSFAPRCSFFLDFLKENDEVDRMQPC